MPAFSPLHQLHMGNVRVTFLADGGGVVDPLATFPSSSEEGWNRHAHLLDADGKFITSIGGFLIELEDRKILIDAGMGPQTVDFPGFGPFKGADFSNSLQQIGVAPEAVTDVLFTHLHLDHCGWISQEIDGTHQLRFTQASHRSSKTEWEAWYGGDHPAGPHPETVQKPLSDHIAFFQEGDEIAPGLVAIGTPGHTLGHMSFVLNTGDERLYLLGDAIHTTAQFQELDWSIAFDADSDMARKSRQHVLDLAAHEGAWIAAGHFSDQVFGKVSKHGDQWQWEAYRG